MCLLPDEGRWCVRILSFVNLLRDRVATSCHASNRKVVTSCHAVSPLESKSGHFPSLHDLSRVDGKRLICSASVLHHGDAPCVFGVCFSRICKKSRSLFLTGGPMNVDTDRTDQGGGTGK